MQSAFEKIARHHKLDLSINGYYLGITPDKKINQYTGCRDICLAIRKNISIFLKEMYISIIF